MVTLAKPYLLFLGDVTDRADAKTALGIAHWRPEDCVGQMRMSPTAVDVGVPDLDFEAAVLAGAKTAIIGIANDGGYIPTQWIPPLVAALASGLDLAAGLHERMADIPELVAASERFGRRLLDIRRPETTFPIATGRKRSGRRLLTVGTDCAVGKKYTALALAQSLQTAGVAASFRATGQTGILISGGGVCIDAVVADFIAGAAETLSPDNEADHWDVVEGQGSLFHPAFAGVSLGLLHGSQPDLIVVCHEAGRGAMSGYRDFAVPDLGRCADANLAAARLTNAAVRLLGFSVNTSSLSDTQARALLTEIGQCNGVPATDPVRFGVECFVERIVAA